MFNREEQQMNFAYNIEAQRAWIELSQWKKTR